MLVTSCFVCFSVWVGCTPFAVLSEDGAIPEEQEENAEEWVADVEAVVQNSTQICQFQSRKTLWGLFERSESSPASGLSQKV